METRLEDLRKWFGKGKKGDWIRVGTDGEIKGDCAREPGEGKPKCMPRDKAHSMSKKDRASAARRKRAADPQADRPGTGNKPIMVKTDKEKKKKVNESSKVPAGMKFIASYVYKDANGNDHTHRHLRKGSKMTDPVVVYIDGKEWKTFQSFTKAKQAAINHIKGMKESVEESTMVDRQVFKAMRIAKDMGGNMTGAVRRIEKMKKGLSDHPKVKAALRSANETYKPDPDGGNRKAVKAAQTRAKIAKYNAQARKANNESVDLEEKNVPTNPALWAKFKAQAKAKFDVYPSAYANGWAAKKYKAAGGGWKTESVKEMKTFWDIREGKESVEQLDELSPSTVKSYLHKRIMDPDHKRTQYSYQKKARDARAAGNEPESAKNRAKAKKIGTGIHRATARDMAHDTGHDKYRHKSVKRVPQAYKDRAQKESVEEAVGDTALAFQTPHGTVTATKRNTKGMRGKQDGYSLSLKTKSGKVVDLGSHPKPTKATVTSIAKNVMS